MTFQIYMYFSCRKIETSRVLTFLKLKKLRNQQKVGNGERELNSYRGNTFLQQADWPAASDLLVKCSCWQ